MRERSTWLRRLLASPDKLPTVKNVINSDGSHDVEIAMRVWVYEHGSDNDKLWVAQGLDINYVASGSSPEDAMERFAKGFMETVAANLEEFNSIEEFAKPAPPEVFQAFFSGFQTVASSRRPLRVPVRDRAVPLPRSLEFLRSDGVCTA